MSFWSCRKTHKFSILWGTRSCSLFLLNNDMIHLYVKIILLVLIFSTQLEISHWNVWSAVVDHLKDLQMWLVYDLVQFHSSGARLVSLLIADWGLLISTLTWTSYTYSVYIPVLFVGMVAMEQVDISILLIVQKCNSSVAVSVEFISSLVP